MQLRLLTQATNSVANSLNKLRNSPTPPNPNPKRQPSHSLPPTPLHFRRETPVFFSSQRPNLHPKLHTGSTKHSETSLKTCFAREGAKRLQNHGGSSKQGQKWNGDNARDERGEAETARSLLPPLLEIPRAALREARPQRRSDEVVARAYAPELPSQSSMNSTIRHSLLKPPSTAHRVLSI